MSLFLRNKFPVLENISNLLYQIDKELHYKDGYGNKDRFSNALVETYNKICGAVGKEPNEATRKMLFDRGQEPFDINGYEYEDFMDGAKEALDFLVEKNCKLKIYTKGLEEYQREKIHHFRLDKWFKDEDIIIVNKKEPKHLKQNSHNLETSCFITDSLEDVKVGIKAGIKVVHIPLKKIYHTKFSNEVRIKTLKKYNELYHKFDNLLEFRDNYHLL